jgi:transposase
MKGIQLSRNKNISAIHFADDQVIISDSEDNLQIAIYKLNKIITNYGLTISADKSKVIAFKGRDPIKSKIVINNEIIQVNTFNYLGNLISYEKEKDIDNKITKYLKITGLINNTFKPNKVKKRYTNKTVYYIGSSSITIWQRNMDSEIKRQIQTGSSRN